MPRRKRTAKRAEVAWTIQADEYHPDPKIAAKYADQNSAIAAAKRQGLHLISDAVRLSQH